MTTITDLYGKRSPDGRLTHPGVAHDGARVEEYVSLHKQVLAEGGIRWVRMRSDEDVRAAVEHKPGLMAKHVFGDAAMFDREGKRVTIKKSAKVGKVRIPFKETVDRSFSPPRMTVSKWIDLDPSRPIPLETGAAIWLLAHDHWGLIVEECDPDGAPIEVNPDVTNQTPAPPRKPGGR